MRARNKKRNKFDIASGITGWVIRSSISRLQRGEVEKDRRAATATGVEGNTVHLTYLSASSAHKRLNDSSFARNTTDSHSAIFLK